MLVSVPEDEEELERFLLAHAPSFRQLLDAAQDRIRQTSGVSHEAFWAPSKKAAAAPKARLRKSRKRRR